MKRLIMRHAWVRVHARRQPAEFAAEKRCRVCSPRCLEILFSKCLRSFDLILQEEAMNKTTILLSVVLVSGLASVKMLDLRPEVPLDSWVEEQRLEDALVSYQCFKRTFEATLAEL